MSGAARWKDNDNQGPDRERFKRHFAGPDRRNTNKQQHKPAVSGNAPAVSSGFPKGVSISVSTQDGSIPFEILVWLQVNCGAISKHSISPDSNQGLIAFTSEKSKASALSLSPVSLENKTFSIEEINEKKISLPPVGQKTDALIIKNLPFSMRPAALTEFLNQFSHPPLSIIFHYLVSGKFKGSALVQYNNVDEASSIMTELSGISIEGRPIRVEYKRPKNNEQEGEEYNQMLNQLQKFKKNNALREFEFPSSLTSYQRKQLHTIATKLNLYHGSRTENGERFLVISKDPLTVDNPRESDSASLNSNGAYNKTNSTTATRGRGVGPRRITGMGHKNKEPCLHIVRQPTIPDGTRGFSEEYQQARLEELNKETKPVESG